MVRSGVSLCELKYFEPNTKVIIEAGPLAGVEGSVVSVNNRHNLIVSITLLRRSVAAEISPELVRRLSPRPALSAAGEPAGPAHNGNSSPVQRMPAVRFHAASAKPFSEFRRDQDTANR